MRIILPLFILLCCGIQLKAQTIIYVDATPSGSGNDGTSWADAYVDLQSALGSASTGDAIWVAAGTYKPTATGERNISFKIKDGVKIYGGFTGNETPGYDLNLRDFTSNKVTLSGDIGTLADNSDNTYHVVRMDSVGSQTVLDGFTISLGNTDGDSEYYGAGLLNYGKGDFANPVLKNLIFQDNNALLGAGLANDGSASGQANPTIENCVFLSNTVSGFGGAVYNNGINGTSSPVFTNCIFKENAASSNGGAVVNWGTGGNSSPTFVNCTFSKNDATYGDGGAIYNYGNSSGISSPEIINCSFSLNTATNSGGAIYNNGDSGTSSPQITNCIFWGNTANSLANSLESISATPTISYSLVSETDCGSLSSGTVCGSGNIFNQNPLFADAANNDLQLTAGSPAINAGNNASNSTSSDLDGNPRIGQGTIDMGAYEFTIVTKYFVKQTATGSNNGKSWTNAFTDLQSALGAVVAGDTIWVAAGTYKPTSDPSPEISFNLPADVKVYGGFSGSEPGNYDLSLRNFVTNETILSGDIGTPGLKTDNSATIIKTENAGNQTRLDGFTITLAYSTSSGGGWYNISNTTAGSSPQMANLKFTDNTAMAGAGLYNNAVGSTANPVLTNCTFSNNIALGGNGGAMLNYSQSGDASPVFTNCVFSGNGATAGGVAINYSQGGMANPSFVNCTFYQNQADSGPVFYNQANSGSICSPLIINSVFWENNSNGNYGTMENINASPSISYSLLHDATCPAGATCGNGMLYNTDPLFIDADNDNLRLSKLSPAINAGNNTSITEAYDFDGNPRVTHGTIDMGAFEYQGVIPKKIFVKHDATGANNGESWTDAFNTLQDGLSAALPDDIIWVAAGVYKPTAGTDRSISFEIPDSVKVYGGFAGNEADNYNLNLRNFSSNETILSGDIGILGDSTDNTYHVIKTVNTSDQTLADGFTVTLGNTPGSGGGWLSSGSKQVLNNITFKNNTASKGGAIAGLESSALSLNQCSFIQNTAYSTGKAEGGAVYLNGWTDRTFTNCLFSENNVISSSASDSASGGAIWNYQGYLTFTNCSFVNNQATAMGAATGGAIFNTLETDGINAISVVNCSFSGNDATSSSSAANSKGGAIYNQKTSFLIQNSILWNNTVNHTSPQSFVHINEGYHAADIRYSLIQENSCPAATVCSNNQFAQNPYFVDAPNGNLRLLKYSPAINSGDTSMNSSESDLDNNPRVYGNTIDLGAYEFQSKPQVFRFVKSDATGSNNGTSWTNAFTDLQSALQIAQPEDDIWVAKGTYKPTSGADRTISFIIPDSVKVYGGFVGNESQKYDLRGRDFKRNETILSGNIGTPESDDNSYHVVLTTNVSCETILDGFTITDGTAYPSAQEWSNRDYYGGGFFNKSDGSGKSSSPKLENLYFYWNAGYYGGAFASVSSHGSSVNPTIINCHFFKNASSVFGGAAVLIAEGSQDINHSSFINCSFVENGYYSEKGAAVFMWGYNLPSEHTFLNCSFTRNSAPSNDGIYILNASAKIKNSIIWNNGANPIVEEDANSHLDIRYSLADVSGYCLNSPDMICNQDPKFMDAANGNLALQCTSPAINAGQDTVGVLSTDILGNNRVGLPDMGAYEFFDEANINYTVSPGTVNVAGVSHISAQSQIQNTSTVEYKAVKSVVLEPGFIIAPENGAASVFSATIGGNCP